jgi:hypothetical protein
MITGKRIISYSHAATDYVSLAEAKQHLRVTSTADDTYISNLLSMAIDACGQYLGYSVRKASVQYGFDSLVGQPAIMNPVNGTEQPVGNLLRIPSRVISLTSVQYVDDNNTAQAFMDYIVSPQPLGTYGRTIFVTSAPSSTTDDVTKYLVTVTEGFELATATQVDAGLLFPQAIKFAALLLVGQMYDNRQAIVTGTIQARMEYGIEFLLQPYRAIQFI